MDIKPMTFEEAFALYNEEPSDDVVIQPIEEPDKVYEEKIED